jgi:hypothetical protein
MATIYLHIGAPKTATSTLQATLSRHSQELLAQGVLYPSACRSGDAHHALACDLITQHQGHHLPDLWYGDVARGTAWQCLATEIAQQDPPVETVVLSSELFFAQTRNIEPMLQDIRRQLAGHVVKVVVYLRRQDQLYSSFYNQDVKGARQWSHSAYQFYQTHQIFQRDYHQRLQDWADVFGRNNVLARPYEREQWHDQDIVRDFCATCGIESLEAGPMERNESLGINQLYIKRCLNRVGLAKEHNDELLAILTALCPEETVANALYVNKAAYQQHRRRWLQTNRRLAADFCGGADFFRQPIPAPEELTRHKVDKFVIAFFLQDLVAQLRRGEHAAHRQLLARAAMLIVSEQLLWEGLDKLDSEARGSLMEWV